MPDLFSMVLPKNSSRTFLQVEHAVYLALGALLSIVAVVALLHAAGDIWHSIIGWNDMDSVFPVMDELLFVLMLGEILHTVRVSMRSGALTAEPFLVVGLIASIRRVLILTFESPKASQNQTWSPQTQALFRASMIELSVLALLILVMVASIVFIRRSASRREEPGPEEQQLAAESAELRQAAESA